MDTIGQQGNVRYQKWSIFSMDAICLPSFVPLLFFPGAVAWASPIDTPEPCLVPQRCRRTAKRQCCATSHIRPQSGHATGLVVRTIDRTKKTTAESFVMLNAAPNSMYKLGQAAVFDRSGSRNVFKIAKSPGEIELSRSGPNTLSSQFWHQCNMVMVQILEWVLVGCGSECLSLVCVLSLSAATAAETHLARLPSRTN
jgi:hypothetical protein